MAFVAPLAAGISSAFSGLGAGTLLTAASGVIGTISAVQEARYQAQVASNNAAIAKKNAEKASDQAQQQQIQADQEAAALMGQQEAIQGASGLSLTGASQLRTRRTAARLGRVDAQNIRDQGNSTIQGYLQESANQTAEAQSRKSSIPGILLGGALNIGSSLISKSASTAAASKINTSSSNVQKFVRPSLRR